MFGFRGFIYIIALVFISCTKKVGKIQSAVAKEKQTLCGVTSCGVVSYSASVQPLLNIHCLPCHSYPGSGGFNLDSYSWVRPTALSGNLTGVITGDPDLLSMPPGNPLDSCDIKTIVNWVKQGALNN